MSTSGTPNLSVVGSRCFREPANLSMMLFRLAAGLTHGLELTTPRSAVTGAGRPAASSSAAVLAEASNAACTAGGSKAVSASAAGLVAEGCESLSIVWGLVAIERWVWYNSAASARASAFIVAIVRGLTSPVASRASTYARRASAICAAVAVAGASEPLGFSTRAFAGWGDLRNIAFVRASECRRATATGSTMRGVPTCGVSIVGASAGREAWP